MSKYKEIIEVELNPINPTEVFTGAVRRCDRCNGRGYRLEEITRNDWHETDCRICKGHGYINAKITVEWIPAKKP